MRTLTSGFATGIDGTDIDVGYLVEIAKPDGTFVRSSTLGVLDVTYGGEVYSGSIGFDVSTLSLTDGDNQPTIDGLTAAGATAPFTFEEAAGGLISGSTVRVFAYLYDVGEGHELGSKWYVGGTALDDAGQFDIDTKAESARNRQLVLKTYGPGCKWDLGGTGCGVNMASFTDSVSVASNADLFTLTITGGSATDDYYANGAIKFTSGALSGISRAVRKYTGSTGTVYLAEPLPDAVSVSDTATIHAGCDKTTGAAGCARFSNFVRRLAWDHLPDGDLSVPQGDVSTSASSGGSDSGFYGDYEGALGGWG